MSPRKEQRRGMQGRARRSKTLGESDPRTHRDPQATYRGDTYKEPLFVDEDGQLAVRIDDSTSPSIEVGPDGLRFAESAGYVLPEPLVVTELQATNITRGGYEVGHQFVPLYNLLHATSSPGWSSATTEIPQNNSDYRVQIDLRRYDEVRFRCVVITQAGATSTIQLGYQTTQTGALVTIGAGTLDLSTGGSTVVDTSWADLVPGAQIASAYVGIIQANITNGTRRLSRVTAEFRAKPAA